MPTSEVRYAVAIAVAVGTLLVSTVAAALVDVPVAGEKLLVKRSRSGKEKLVYVARDAALPTPTIGSPDDPTVAGGALVEIVAATSSAVGAFVVPPDRGDPGWTVNDRATDKFKYRSKTAPGTWSVVRTLLLKEGKVLKVVAKRAGLALEGNEGAVGIRVTVGGVRVCSLFSGASIKEDLAGRYRASNAPASNLVDCSDVSLGTTPFLSAGTVCPEPADKGLSVANGIDLHKVTLTDPLAVCNDGTPALLHVRRAPAGSPHANDWLIWLEGGGGCGSPASCAERWCGDSPPYGPAKMSSTFAPFPAIRGNGIFSQNLLNNFRDFNMVTAYYCSSDTWAGTRTLDAPPSGATPGYRIAFHGHHIVSAMIAALRAGVTSDDAAVTLPSIDTAARVLFTGTSAGGAGSIHNVDRVRELLLDGNRGLDFQYMVDAIFSPWEEDVAHGYPAADVELDLALRDARRAFQGVAYDTSCVAYHFGDDPRICGQPAHVGMHHIGMPFFAKQDLEDPVLGPAFFTNLTAFGQATRTMLQDFELRTTAAEEPTARRQVAIFAPRCRHHVALESSSFFDVELLVLPDPAVDLSQTMWAWWDQGVTPFVIDGVDGALSVCLP
jgi:hypothetical protein